MKGTVIVSDHITDKFEEIMDFLEKKNTREHFAKAFKALPVPIDADEDDVFEMRMNSVRDYVSNVLFEDEHMKDVFSEFAIELAFESVTTMIMPTEEDIKNAKVTKLEKKIVKFLDSIMDEIISEIDEDDE